MVSAGKSLKDIFDFKKRHCRAWNIAERCVEHTRDLLQRAHFETAQNVNASTSTETSNCAKVEEELLIKYSTQVLMNLFAIVALLL